MRPLYWIKNLLIFAPFSPWLFHGPAPWSALPDFAAAFVGFSGLASASYLFNDCVDLSQDRLHRGKKTRPLAAGTLSVTTAGIAALILCALGLSVLVSFGPATGELAALYLIGTLLYSLFIKRVPVLNVALVGAFHSLRVLLGGLLAGMRMEPAVAAWLYVFFVWAALQKRRISRFQVSGELSREPAIARWSLALLGFWLALLAWCLHEWAAPPKIWAASALLGAWAFRFDRRAEREPVLIDPLEWLFSSRVHVAALALFSGVLLWK